MLHADLLYNLGQVRHGQGEDDEARDHYEHALAIVEKELGTDHPRVAASLNSLGVALESQGKNDEARDCYERALAILEKALGPVHPKVTVVLIGLGRVARAQGKYDDARKLFARCARSYSAFATDPIALYNGACCYALASDENRAFEMLEKALEYGFRNAAYLEKDSDLTSLRNDPRWMSLVAKMKAE